jgi:hypothetical protein
MTTQKNFENNAFILVICLVLAFLVVLAGLCLTVWGVHDLVSIIKAVIVAWCAMLALIGVGVAVILWMVK